jgi:putative Holliday junction resolvase
MRISQKILAIDFGLKKIGLALAQDGFIQPLMVVNKETSLSQINRICQENEIEKIVLGLPPEPLAQKVKEYAQSLRQKVKLSVEFQDETLTSREALAKMIEGGKKRKVRQQKQDAYAAACILEAYLQRKEAHV